MLLLSFIFEINPTIARYCPTHFNSLIELKHPFKLMWGKCPFFNKLSVISALTEIYMTGLNSTGNSACLFFSTVVGGKSIQKVKIDQLFKKMSPPGKSDLYFHNINYRLITSIINPIGQNIQLKPFTGHYWLKRMSVSFRVTDISGTVSEPWTFRGQLSIIAVE